MHRNMHLGLLLLTFLLGACDAHERDHKQSAARPIDVAKSAYFQFDLAAASEQYTKVWEATDTSINDRVTAGQALMRIAWHFHQDVDRARSLAGELVALRTEIAVSLTSLAQIEFAAGDFTAAMATADKALAHAESRPERDAADVVYAQAVTFEAVEKTLAGNHTSVDLALVREALARANSVLNTQQGLAAPSLVALNAALILNRGSNALDAWRSYFHVRAGSPTNSVLTQPGSVLTQVLGDGYPQRSRGEFKKLVRALTDSRLFEAAALVSRMHLHEQLATDSEISEVVEYETYLKEIGKLTEAFYRDTAAGTPDESAYKQSLERHAKALWPNLRWTDEAPGFSKNAFQDEISRRFGAEISFKTLSGYFGLHMGHRVVDEDFLVEQYDESAKLRFISLDFVVSNGFTSWFWDGRAEVGGWAANPTIIQIRSAYADDGIRAWKRATDPKTRARIEREIAERAGSDIEVARTNPHAFLPGMAQRIRQIAYEKLLERLSATGLTGSELQLAFIAEVERINLESSIIAHEGRHAIESRSMFNFLRPSAEKEFLAKLSEVAFSSVPKLAISGGILSNNIGDDSSHGKANARIMKGIVEWMDKNRGAIEQLDASLPLLPQLDLLSDEQLRTAFRSMDSMAP